MRMRIKTVMEQMNSEKPDEVLAELEAKYAHDERDEPKRKRYISCKDRMCGSTTCEKCNPWNFRGGVFVADCDSEEAED